MDDNHLFIDEDHLSKDSGISEEEGATSNCLSLENTSKCRELFEQYSDLFEQDTNGDEDSLLSKNLDLDCFKFPSLDLEAFKNEGKKSSTGSGSSFSSSKEEKEKQNEELIIMKGATINNLNLDREEIKESCKDFLLTERIFSSQNIEIPKVIPAPCFIDASSLLDDDTVCPYLNGNFSLKDDSLMKKKTEDDKIVPEIFGSGEFTEKFLTKKYSLSNEGRSYSHPENGLKLESIFNSDNDLTKLRQEQEKKQGNLVFKNSIQHFSQHFVDPDSLYDEKPGIETNLSLTEKGFSFLPDTPHNSIVTTDGCRYHYGKQFDDNISDVKTLTNDSYGDERNKQQELTKNMVWTIDMNKSDELVKKNILESPDISLEHEQETRKSSLGFFVDLSDVQAKKSDEKLIKNDFMKKSTGFYVDLSDESNSSITEKPIEEKTTIPQTNDGKKPLFSLFIDFGENKTNKKPVRYEKRIDEKSSEKLLKNETKPESSPPPEEEINNRTVSITSDSSNIDNDLSSKTETNYQSDFSSNHDFTQINDDVRTNATFDKNSPDSITDEIFSKDTSPDHFKTDSLPVILEDKKCNIEKVPTHTMETLQATVERQKKLLESTTNIGESDSLSFVKLSDMDKPVAPVIIPKYKSKKMSSSETGFGYSLNTLKRNFMFSNDVNSYMSQSTGNNITNLASTLENSRSLTRLFPHLSKVFSNSLPSNVELAEVDYISSDFSYTSSVTSSHSVLDSLDDLSLSLRQPKRLGEDLLKMFLHEIGTDVQVQVDGRKMGAHKCILRSRCQYFAAILAGHWLNNMGNVISLSGFSYGAVHFALCHIYSGASHPPTGISLIELTELSDLLGLEGLKEVTAYELKESYCHNFHKPCDVCIKGIIEVLPMSLTHGLDDLYRKCLKWVCKYFIEVWSTRSFSNLNSDIMYRCRQQVVAHLNSENVLNTFINCEDVLTFLNPFKWSLNVVDTVKDISHMCNVYISQHFSNLIASDSFLSLGHGQSCFIIRLENNLLRIASSLKPEQACKSYQRIVRLKNVLSADISSPYFNERFNIFDKNNLDNKDEDEFMDWNEDFIKLVNSIVFAIEQCLVRQCERAMKCTSWNRINIEMRKKIQTLASHSESFDVRRIRPVVKNSPRLSFTPYQNRAKQELPIPQTRTTIYATSKRLYDQSNNSSSRTQSSISNDSGFQRNQKSVDKSVQANRLNSVKPKTKPAEIDVKPKPAIRTTVKIPEKKELKKIEPKQLSTVAKNQRNTFGSSSSLKSDKISTARRETLPSRLSTKKYLKKSSETIFKSNDSVNEKEIPEINRKINYLRSGQRDRTPAATTTTTKYNKENIQAGRSTSIPFQNSLRKPTISVQSKQTKIPPTRCASQVSCIARKTIASNAKEIVNKRSIKPPTPVNKSYLKFGSIEKSYSTSAVEKGNKMLKAKILPKNQMISESSNESDASSDAMINNDDFVQSTSKLERSTTFCKENSDIPLSDLKIIE